MRMLAGILAAHPFTATMTGDDSLRRRPMRRVIVPLERMGARIGSEDGRPPLSIQGVAPLQPIEFSPEVPSAQVKSAVLLAGLHASGATTRPRAPGHAGSYGAGVARVRCAGRGARTFCRQSTAASASAAASRGPGRYLVGGVLDGRCRVAFGLRDRYSFGGAESDPDRHHRRPAADGRRHSRSRAGQREVGEPIGTIRVRHGHLGSTEIAPAEVPGVIDELPVLGALATHGGELRVTGAQELRVKESDRISALADGLRRMGGGHRGAARRVSRPWDTASARRRGGRAQRPSPGDGLRDRRARRLGADDDSRRGRRGRVVSRVLLRARVAAGVKADKLYLVGFMGAGKTHGGTCAGAAPRVACGGHRRAHRGARAAIDCGHLRAAGRGLLPPARAAGAQRAARRPPHRSSPPAAAPSPSPTIAR